MAIRTELHHLLDETLDNDPRRSLIAVRRLHDGFRRLREFEGDEVAGW